MKKTLLLSILFIALFSSCKKDQVIEDTLKGKWTVQNIITKEYVNNVLTSTEDEPGDGTTLDFQDNGNVVITQALGVKSFPFTLSGSNVSFEGDTYQIKDLTKSSATLYLKDDLGSGNYYESLVNLKR